MRRILRLLFLMSVGLIASACHENATLFTVNTTADTVDVNAGDGLCGDSNGDCSLRAAIMEANALPGVEKIQLTDGVTYTLTRPGTGEDLSADGDLDITSAVVLAGDGTIDANGLDRVLDLHHGAGLVELDGPNLTGGSAANGAALHHTAAGFTSVVAADIIANTASGAPVGVTNGSLFLWDSSVTGNSGAVAGAVQVSGGAVNGRNLTLSGNTGAPALVVSAGSATLAHATITDNAGGIAQSAAGTVAVGSSLVVSQTSGADCTGTIESNGFNIESGSTCGFDGGDELQNVSPALAPLALNGGAVLTHLPSGAAINGAANASCDGPADARGVARPFGHACDVGAVELDGLGSDCATPGPGADLRFCDLSGQALVLANLAGADLTGADLDGANLVLADLTGASLAGANLEAASLADATLTNADLRGTVLSDAVMTRTVLTGANLSSARLLGVIGSQLTTTPALLTPEWAIGGETFVGREVDLTDVDLSGADLTGVNLRGSTLDGVVLDGATITDLQLADALTDGLQAGPNLVGTPSSLPPGWFSGGGWLLGPGADLTGGSFPGVDLTNRDLSRTNLQSTDLSNKDLSGTDLSFARMVSTNILNTDLTGATMWRLFSDQTIGSPLLPSGWARDRTALWGPGVDLRGLVRSGGSVGLSNVDLTDALLTGASINSFSLLNVTAVRTNFDDFSTTGSFFLLRDSDATDASFQRFDAPNVSTYFERVDLDGADFTDADLTTINGRFYDNDIEGAVFTGATLDELDGTGNTGTPIDLPATHTLAKGVLVHGNSPYLNNADVSGLDLSNSQFDATWANMTAVGTDFSGSSLDTIWTGGDFTNANFDGARIRSLRDVDITGASFVDADFRDLDSRGLLGTPAALPIGYSLIDGAVFGPWTRPTGVSDLSGRSLIGLDWTEIDLPSGVDFTNTALAVTDLRGASMVNADFTGANLAGSLLDGADLSGATWSNTICPDGTLSSANGNSCVGVDPINHQEIVHDPTGSATQLAGDARDLGYQFIRPTLTHVQGATVVPGNPAGGVDWYIDDILYRDNDYLAPYEIRSNQPLITDFVFNGQGSATGTTFFIGVGVHTIRAEATTTAGVLTFTATFRIDEP